MTRTKIERKLKDFLEKVGNVILLQLIDYYYRDETCQRLGWKIREEYTVEEIINMGLGSNDIIGGGTITGREIIDYLDKYKGKPLEQKVKYADTYAKYCKDEAENDELKKQNYKDYMRTLDAMGITNLYHDLPHVTTYSQKRGKRKR